VTVLVPDPDLGPARCRACGAAIVWALTPGGHLLAVNSEPCPANSPGPLELYVEYFPGGGELVDDIQRVRLRPPDRPPSSPSWTFHWGAPRPCRSIG
jgi:hypothetical protein